ncbi:hypothetical protein ACAG24_029460, partial [Mycobacterium sp. pW049]
WWMRPGWWRLLLRVVPVCRRVVPVVWLPLLVLVLRVCRWWMRPGWWRLLLRVVPVCRRVVPVVW